MSELFPLFLHYFSLKTGTYGEALEKLCCILKEKGEEALLRTLTEKGREKWKIYKRSFFKTNWLQELRKRNISWICWEAPQYPEVLKNLPFAPLLLFYQGDLQKLEGRHIAVIGTRHPSLYGLSQTTRLVKELVQLGFSIVSGVALGIDAAAHKAALEIGGNTIGILGCGIGRIYPKENAFLFQKLKTQGLLLSEYFPGTPPLRHHFPWRNRLISGLSLGVLVIEGTLKSGSMITAKWALDQGKEVFALPGPADSPLSQAPHYLIQQGGKLVTSGEDIQEEFCFSKKTASLPPDLLDFFSSPKSLEEIQNRLSLDLPLLFQKLLQWEMEGCLQKQGSFWFTPELSKPNR